MPFMVTIQPWNNHDVVSTLGSVCKDWLNESFKEKQFAFNFEGVEAEVHPDYGYSV